MQVLTKAQKLALKRVFDRTPLFVLWDGKCFMPTSTEGWNAHKRLDQPTMTYRSFRYTAVTSFGTLIVPWCGMWLAIETDGYTHS
jgi:hypothetical protein